MESGARVIFVFYCYLLTIAQLYFRVNKHKHLRPKKSSTKERSSVAGRDAFIQCISLVLSQRVAIFAWLADVHKTTFLERPACERYRQQRPLQPGKRPYDFH